VRVLGLLVDLGRARRHALLRDLANNLAERELLVVERVGGVGCGGVGDSWIMPTVILVAPDGFKGTLAAADVARALADGLREGGQEAEELPIGDGGEGTMDALVATLGGEFRTATVTDPLGRPVKARFALLPDGRALVETAEASGLALVKEDERDPWAASTRGTGELIAAAVEAGADEVLVTVGGSATTDGGAGALEALEEAGVNPKLEVLCDVRTVFEDAPKLFGPQKGADAKMVKRLERRLAKLADAAPRDPRGVRMTGAAGGLSGGLYAYRKAKLVPGAAYVLDTVGFDERMREARFVVTGEGKLDDQTLAGKAVGEIATRCRQGGVACHAVVGVNALDPFAIRLLDFASVTEAGTKKKLRRVGTALARERA
jgi:glycerate kinase